MGNAAEHDLIRDISRDVLTRIAPQELPLFPAASAAWFADPAAAKKASKSRDAALGFGTDAFSILLTPLVLQIVSEIMPVLGSIALKVTENAVGEEVSMLVRKMFHRDDANADAALTSEQLGEVHRNVIAAGERLRLESAQTQRLADAVVAQFVLQKK
ncbi:hypothetical protein NOV72_04921 [Caballeronia novacaledonica]|uniref:Uncharacterized protein n=1 Tax=Caballeronia novacaledonica TaxID=1544861 RepID=A0A2U3IBX7_9BURK|nr:hypothetical protein [Caballeronia novacaledonica]SPB17716.1 hypothetical protein NOV72_04921 [Caballeronia novacaledonica]